MLQLRSQPLNSSHTPVVSKHEKLQRLLDEIKDKEIPAEVEAQINREIQRVNDFEGGTKEEFGLLSKAFSNIHGILNKELGFIKQGFYMGMGLAFGIPIGLLLSVWTPFPLYGAPALGLLAGALASLVLEGKAKKEGKLLLTR